jgi:hypothetical protein
MRFKSWYFIFFFLGVFWLALFARIYTSRLGILEGWDESIYAQLGVEFAKHPDFIASYNGEFWLEKPFLIGFVTGLIHFISPYNTVLLRSFFSLVGVANLYLVWKVSADMLVGLNENRRNILALASPIFTVLTYLFVERSTTINTDILLVFGLLGFYAFRDKFWIKLGFLCVAVWTKSLLGFLPLILEIVLNYKTIFTKKDIFQNSLMLLVPSLWYIYAYTRFGDEFIQKHFVEQIFSRASSTLESHTGDWWYYIEYFVRTSPLAVLFALMASVCFFVNRPTQATSYPKLDFKNISPILLGLIYLILISASKSKLEWYLLPVIFLLSPLVSLLLKNSSKQIIVGIISIFGCLSLIFVSLTPLFSRNSPENTALVEVAKCISNQPQQKVLIYQTNAELNNYKNLVNSNGSISSTFRYGGNPAFVYYARKSNVDFVYFNIVDPVDLNTIRVYPKTQYPNLAFTNKSCDTSGYTVYLP